MTVTKDAPRQGAAVAESDRASSGTAGDGAEASRKILNEIHHDHVVSLDRNTKDSAKDADAITGDRDSLKVASTTGALAEKMQKYLAGGGDFKDPDGKKLAQEFITSLRKQHDDNSSDRKTDLEYAGKTGMPEDKRQSALKSSTDIAEAAKKLADPSLSPADRQKLLDGVVASATAIGTAVADPTGMAGKDQRDAGKEALVIKHDAQALQLALKIGNLTPEQQAKLVADMGSKAGLIQKELGDIPNEIGYAQNDTRATKAGGDMEAVVRYAMQNHNPKALQQLVGMLTQYHDGGGHGTLDAVVGDRKQDLALEPQYIAANTRDNETNNKVIIEFSDPYKRH